MYVAKANALISCSMSTTRDIGTVRCTHSSGSPRRLRHLTEIFPVHDQKGHHFPHAYLKAIDAKASSLSTVAKDCRVVRGLLPFRFTHLEKLFSYSVFWHLAELIEDCQNGRTADVTFL
jgi:hypothetical protein